MTWPDPPTDNGSDRYGYVEIIDAPPDVIPTETLVDGLLRDACQDCNPNLFLRWRPNADGNTGPSGPSYWHVTVAHDTACPTYEQLKREGRLNPI